MTYERRENHYKCTNALETRINCPRCNDTRERLYIKKVRGGFVRHCKNENCYEKDGFIPDALTTPKETVSNVLFTKQFGSMCMEQATRKVCLPYDTSNNIPAIGLGWLYKYYITDEEIKKYNICYSESYKRLILPVYNETGLIYWQGRSLKPPYTKENPKYLNIRQSGAKNVFFKIKNIHYTTPTNKLVIVEDILSAIRVGRVCNSLALLGSYFPTSVIEEFKPYEKIIIYLDYDKRDTAIKQATRFNKLTGKPIQVLVNLNDPKELSPKTLESILED